MLPNEQNDTIVDISSCEDLPDAYEKLSQKYIYLKKENDCLNQKCHQLIRQKKVTEDTLNDIQSELDSINDVNTQRLQQLEKTNEELRTGNQNLKRENQTLENKVEDLYETIETMNNELKEVRGLLAVKAIKPRVSDTYARSLEIENENFRCTIHEMKEQLEELTAIHSENLSKVEELTENIECMKDNLETKKIELEEKNENLDLLNDKVQELSAELALLKSSDIPDDTNRKGNSLFAELDDQRQKIKKILQGERLHYLEMKRAYNSKEIEIRRLKRENLNIKLEIQECSNQLKRGEQLSSDHMKIYISNLEGTKQKLEMELKQMEFRLKDIAGDQKMHWVETVLTASSKEVRDIKDKFYVLLREKTLLADNHCKALKELAKARLDSIKLKVLLGRIVDDFKLKIDESQYDDLQIDDLVFENLKLENLEVCDEENILEESMIKQQNESLGGSLNESTIILLGGREKLGNAIPNLKQNTESVLIKSLEKDDIGEKSINADDRKPQNIIFGFEKTQKLEVDENCKKDTEETATDQLKDIAKENLPATNILPPKTIIKSEVLSPLKENIAPKSDTTESKDLTKVKTENQESVALPPKKQMYTIKRVVIQPKKPKL